MQTCLLPNDSYLHDLQSHSRKSLLCEDLQPSGICRRHDIRQHPPCRDQRLYKQAAQADGTFTPPEALTPADSQYRFADGIVDKKFDRLVVVREDHSNEGEPINTVAAVGG